MAHLLDVNVLIALAWPSHVHHHKAHDWFSENERFGWATCPLTQCGFVRVSSNPKIIPDAVTPRDAIAALEIITASKRHIFWPDSIGLNDPNAKFSDMLIFGHRQVTDAYLLRLALLNKGKLATFDKNIAHLFSPESPYQNSITLLSS